MKRFFYVCATLLVIFAFSCSKDNNSGPENGGNDKPAPPDTTAQPSDTTTRPPDTTVQPPDTTGKPEPEFPAVLPSVGKIPIVAWIGVRESFISVERFQEAAELGITINLSTFGNLDNACRALEYAEQAGIKMIVGCDALNSESERENAVRKLMKYPALEAYFIGDEPHCAQFPAFAKTIRTIQSIDPGHYCYSNILPCGTPADLATIGVSSYREYVNRYLNEVPVTFLSFDEYPVITEYHLLKETWYSDLEIISDEAKKANLKFWAFALTCPHGGYPVPTRADLRLQLYSALAYGAQVLQYFTYWAPSPGTLNYRLAPIAADGTRTETYGLVKSVTSEIQKYNGVFLGASVLWVRHTGTIPPGTQQLTELPPKIKKLDTRGSGALVSLLENQGYTFLTIVNRDPNSKMTLNFEAEEGVRRVQKDGSLIPANGQTALSVEPGDAVIYMWQ